MAIEGQKMVKKTYSLPQFLVQKFENMTPKRERSKVISKIIEKWIEERERKRLREQIITGCKEMASIYLEIEKEYHPLEEEVERSFKWELKGVI